MKTNKKRPEEEKNKEIERIERSISQLTSPPSRLHLQSYQVSSSSFPPCKFKSFVAVQR
jgi:hypothetical protein